MAWELEEKYKYWFAALVDGEGWIGISRRKRRNGSLYLYPELHIANTNLTLLLYAKSLWSSFQLTQRINKPPLKIGYRLKLHGTTKLIIFLQQITPYLIVKKAVAEEVINYCFLRINKRALKYHVPYDNEDLEMTYRVNKLNKRGT